MKTSISENLYQRACRHLPAGVNSPVRAFKSVGGAPVYMVRGKGSKMYDADDNEYIDFCGSWGPLILGHARREITAAVAETAARGLSFGTCNPLEVEFAELFCKLVPGVEMIRMVNSGTEAVMTALRLARACTGRNKLIKFDGCYHGHADHLLVAAGSGLLTNSMPASLGVTDSTAAEVISTPYNDIDAIEKIFQRDGNDIAAVIVEPVAGNMGLVMPEPDFLPALRRICSKYGALLVFDEVITGFRFHAGSFAALINVSPDISTFGKIVGGGLPVGVVAASREIMERLAPLGQVYQAGTLSGNPVAAAAGIATMKLLSQLNPYPTMFNMASLIAFRINEAASEGQLPVHCAFFGSVFTIFFSAAAPLRNLNEVKRCDTARFAVFFHYMLEQGFYLSPSQFELNFVSVAHTGKEINRFANAVVNFIENNRT